MLVLIPVIHASPVPGQLVIIPPAVPEWSLAGGQDHDRRLPVDAYEYGNPAGCSSIASADIPVEKRLVDVQQALGDTLNLDEARQYYIWNGPNHSMVNVMEDRYAFEFNVDAFRPPYTYKADTAATIFLTHGFVVWFRSYGGSFRLLAIPMQDGVYDSAWGDYVRTYWQPGGIPEDDTIVPVMKKLPCHWVIDQGYATREDLSRIFNLDWHPPDYLEAGRKYLAATCEDANRISQEEIGYWDARSVCGPLTWRIVKDVHGFPYRIGNWESGEVLFTMVNPRWNGRPWIGFDPETYDLIQIDEPMAGYDFSGKGNLYTGDILYSYSTMYTQNDGRFDHIFLVAGVREDQSRVSITNMVQSSPQADCSIREVTLYTPGSLMSGVINHEWNNHGFGSTGSSGFDVFRWKWITYHVEGKSIPYTVRWGDTVETIAFDWKISPQSILEENDLEADVQLVPGQTITLPAPGG